MMRHGIDPKAGCSVPRGWMHMVDALLTVLMDVEGFRPEMVTQVKAKFCELRLYVDNVPEGSRAAVDRLIAAASGMSVGLCQDCGAPSDDPPKAMMGRRLCAHCKGTAAA